jgi:hypothetical protein
LLLELSNTSVNLLIGHSDWEVGSQCGKKLAVRERPYVHSASFSLLVLMPALLCSHCIRRQIPLRQMTWQSLHTHSILSVPIQEDMAASCYCSLPW